MQGTNKRIHNKPYLDSRNADAHHRGSHSVADELAHQRPDPVADQRAHPLAHQRADELADELADHPAADELADQLADQSIKRLPINKSTKHLPLGALSI